MKEPKGINVQVSSSYNTLRLGSNRSIPFIRSLLLSFQLRLFRFFNFRFTRRGVFVAYLHLGKKGYSVRCIYLRRIEIFGIARGLGFYIPMEVSLPANTILPEWKVLLEREVGRARKAEAVG